MVDQAHVFVSSAIVLTKVQIVFQVRRGKIVATSREVRWHWWPVTVISNLNNHRHASRHVVHEVTVEKPHPCGVEQYSIIRRNIRFILLLWNRMYFIRIVYSVFLQN
jgi:hypothetical protein